MDGGHVSRDYSLVTIYHRARKKSKQNCLLCYKYIKKITAAVWYLYVYIPPFTFPSLTGCAFRTYVGVARWHQYYYYTKVFCLVSMEV